jgi:hypothetical protein
MALRRGGDDTGKTIQYTKTTYDPVGDIVHVNDRINEGHARPFVLQAAMMSLCSTVMRTRWLADYTYGWPRNVVSTTADL